MCTAWPYANGSLHVGHLAGVYVPADVFARYLRLRADELVFVAMFFASLRPGKTSNEEGQDDEREGHVVALSAATNGPLLAPNPIVLAPIADTGFRANGKLSPAVGLVPVILLVRLLRAEGWTAAADRL